MKLKRITIAVAIAMMMAGNAIAAPATTRSATPAFELDFTDAAEKTVNAVVCIKSYEFIHKRQVG